jgi:hypothetical protein
MDGWVKMVPDSMSADLGYTTKDQLSADSRCIENIRLSTALQIS